MEHAQTVWALIKMLKKLAATGTVQLSVKVI